MARDHHTSAHTPGFGADRAVHYDAQSAVSLAGVQAMYELGASALTTALDENDAASLRFVGLGTGAELVPYTRFDVPGWSFTGVDPSDAMLEVAEARLAAEGLAARTKLHVGELRTLPPGPRFDGGQMLGVLHHIAEEADRLELLHEVTRRMRPGAPLVVGCRVGMDPELWDIELRRWRTYGIAREVLSQRREALMSMPFVASDAALFEMFAKAGLRAPRTIFVSLQFKVFLVRSEAVVAR